MAFRRTLAFLFAPLLVAWLALNSPAGAKDLAGSWAVKAGGITIFRFDLSHDRGSWDARWSRPEKFNFDGEGFKSVSGPVIILQASRVKVSGIDVEMTFPDASSPEDGGDSMPDIFKIHRTSAGQTELEYVGAGFPPFSLIADSSPQLTASWAPDRVYTIEIVRQTNPEMTAIFEADQADRKTTPHISRNQMRSSDTARRLRVKELMDSGALDSGDDYYHAAFIFQHGISADDILTAHILAMAAISRGKSSAAWIASATLDRYLQTIGRPQVLGTQFKMREDGAVDQEPYLPMLIPDSLRRALNVPTVDEQKAQREQIQRSQYDRREKAAKP